MKSKYYLKPKSIPLSVEFVFLYVPIHMYGFYDGFSYDLSQWKSKEKLLQKAYVWMGSYTKQNHNFKILNFRQLYWSEVYNNGSCHIMMSNLDGSSITGFITENLENVTGLTLDYNSVPERYIVQRGCFEWELLIGICWGKF